MAVRFPESIHLVDPVELEINKLFNHLIMCLNQRRVALLTTYREIRAQIVARPIARARKEEELSGLKTYTESLIQMNEVRETQERILAKIELKLAEVRVPHPETHAVFRGNFGPLEQVIAGMAEVVEEEVPAVPLEVPAVGSNMPAVDSNMHAVDSNMPAVDSNMPAVDSNMPTADSNMPAVDSNMPAVDSNIPDVSQEGPVVDSNIPDVTQDVSPIGLKKVPDVGIKVSDVHQQEVKSKNVSYMPKKVQFGREKVPDVHQKDPDDSKKVSVVPRYEQMGPIVAVGKNGYAPGELWNP